MTVQAEDPDFCRPAAEHDQHHVNNFYSHQVYITELDGNPHFEALWDALTRKPEDRYVRIRVAGGCVEDTASCAGSQVGPLRG